MESIDLSPAHAAIVDTVCMMTVIDGELAAAEYEFVIAVFRTMFELDEDVSKALVENSLGRLRQVDLDLDSYLDGALDRLGDPEYHHSLLVALFLTSMADGIVHGAELNLVDVIAERLDLTDAEVELAESAAATLYQRLV
ncbi:MAG: TerB family tellurite resistance protein [Myxococcota bacterium]